METGLKVRMSPELMAAFSARDEEGNRLTLEKGEPDAEGFYCPTVTVHPEDNPMRALREAGNVLDSAWAHFWANSTGRELQLPQEVRTAMFKWREIQKAAGGT